MRPRGTTGILLLPVLLAAGTGCEALTDTGTTIFTGTGEPVIEIDPSAFLYACAPGTSGTECPTVPVVCAAIPGAMQSYVATFVDEGPAGYPGPGFTLPSSPATSCSQRVAFTEGITGHRYSVHIDGYTQRPEEIVPVCSVKPAYSTCADGSTMAPLGNGTCTTNSDCFANGCYGRCTATAKQTYDTTAGICVTDTANPGMVNVCDYQQAPGDRHMLDRATFTPVSPRWATPSGLPCGYKQLTPLTSFERFAIADCEPLEVSSTGTPVATGIAVRPTSTLGSYSCADVKKFDVEPINPAGIASQDGIACETAGDVVFTQGIVPGTEHFFRVLAYDGIHLSPTLSATCVATPVEGVVVTAKCLPLEAIGP